MGNQSAYLLLRVIPLVPNLLTPTQTLLGGAVGLVGIASFFAVDLDWIGLDWIGLGWVIEKKWILEEEEKIE